MYAIYGNIYHQYTPNVSIYIPYMDPMGNWGGTTLQISDSHPPCAEKDPSRVSSDDRIGCAVGSLEALMGCWVSAQWAAPSKNDQKLRIEAEKKGFHQQQVGISPRK